jgi:hypothetical protein
VTASFWNDFLTNVAASVAAGLVLLYLTYLFIDHRLHLRDRAEREEADRKARAETREAVLTAVLEELQDNAARVQVWLKILPKGHIPYPGFNATGWPLIAQAPVFTTLSAKTVAALTHAYNRMESANEMLAFVADLNHGPTAILVNAMLAEPLERKVSLVQEAADKFEAHRDSTREMLIGRVIDLKTTLDNAIDAVESELNRPGPVPAAQRIFKHEDSVALRQLEEIEGAAESSAAPSSGPP